MLVHVYQVPQRAQGQPALDDNFLGLMFGMSVQEVQRRYELRLVKTDANYHYILIKPRLAAHKQEFIEARLVFWQQTSLPWQTDFTDTTGIAATWEALNIYTNPKIGSTDLQYPHTPRGWQQTLAP